MLKYQFVPAQSGLFSFALPCFYKLGSVAKSDSIITSLSTEEFYSLLSRQTGVWGVNVDVIGGVDQLIYRDLKTMGCNVVVKNKECFFIGPPVVFYDDGQTNMVLGIDPVVLPEMKSDFQMDDEEELMVVDSFDKIPREPKYKVLNQGFFDYGPAVDKGNELLKRYGIRTGSNVNFYGEYLTTDEDGIECALIVCVPNNRMMNPCAIKTVYGTKNKVEEDILMFLSQMSLLGKDYSNFYMFRETIDPGKYLIGVFDFASVLVQYHIDTSVRLVGTHDHHENAGTKK